MAHRALIHRAQDDVAVAVADLEPGERLEIPCQDGSQTQRVTAVQAIPLGHKLALRDLPEGHEVLEYGQAVGVTTAPIRQGEHVHVHNLRSKRWGKSVAGQASQAS